MDDGVRGLKLWNTLTREKESFRPLDWRGESVPEADRRVRMYVCGPTVYDFAHIGNARPVIVFDVLFRLLRQLYGDNHVTYVRNITDVDDKINARAARDFPDMDLNEAIRRVTTATADQFHADIGALGCLAPTHEPRATEFVARESGGDMVAMIQTLLAKGHAYEAGGEVLFDVTSMADYGRLSNRRLEDQQAGARVAVDSHKRNPGDFVLWKLSDASEPGWESPWGRGRPGWHLECSVMSAAFLGETFDIHGGGLDLVFPHHENEIAQSRCAHGTQRMAEVWMHNGYLQLEGRKMSKSEGNFVTIHDLLATEKFGGRKWPGEVLRLAMLMTHYREPIDFSVKRLEEAETILRKLYRIADEVAVPADKVEDVGGGAPRFLETLSDDLNTPAAIAEVQKAFEEVRDAAGRGKAVAHAMLAAETLGLTELAAAFTRTADLGLEKTVRTRIDERLALIREKDFAEADRIRDELLQQGIQLKDGKDPETGERVTTWEVRR